MLKKAAEIDKKKRTAPHSFLSPSEILLGNVYSKSVRDKREIILWLPGQS